MSAVMTGTNPVQDAEHVLRSVWGDRGLPVDPVLIAHGLGINVADATLPENVSAAIISKAGQDPQILLNAVDSRNRKRFSCAHEIGHFIRRSEATDSYEYVDLRGPLSAQGMDPEEVYANNFAACLLMPEAEVRRLYAESPSLVSLMAAFGISQDAMRFRLMNLGLA